MTESTKSDTVKEWVLKEDWELRFEIESKTQVVVEVCFVDVFLVS